jgi:23S rRNA (uracil1939-C5)-methyltransferase
LSRAASPARRSGLASGPEAITSGQRRDHRRFAHRVAPCPYFAHAAAASGDIAYRINSTSSSTSRALRRIGKFVDPPVPSTVPSESWGYRNHARFSLDREGHLGFVGAGSRRPIPIERCLIMDSAINEALSVLQAHHTSLTRRPGKRLHQIAVRYGVGTSELLVNPDLSDRGVPLPSGQPLYHEALLERRFQVSAASFFQVNTPQAEMLVRLVSERLALTGYETVVDAYAGVGTFAALLAGRAARIIAIEESAAAIQDAKVNLAGLDNVELIAGKVERVLPDLDVQPDAVIVDPPRIRFPVVLQPWLTPRCIVYVSCRGHAPATSLSSATVAMSSARRCRSISSSDLPHQAVATLEFTGA